MFSAQLKDPPGDVWSRADLSGVLAEMARSAASEGLYVPDPLLPFDAVASKEVFENYRSHVLASIDGFSPKNLREQEGCHS